VDRLEHEVALVQAVLLIGALTVIALFVKNVFRRLGVPGLVGLIAVGFALRVVDARLGVIGPEASWILEFLARMGVVALLFRVGLESDVGRLLGQLRRAGLIWAGNVAASGALGYVACRYLLDLGSVPSLFVAIGLTATSVGVSVGTWRDAGKLKSGPGELMLDVAELDDISGVVLMALLFGVLPVLRSGGSGLFSAVSRQLLIVLGRLALFSAGCLLFSRHLERRYTTWARSLAPEPDPMIVLAGLALVIAGLAGLLRYSLAIGAFFAGLVFSRDPRAVRIEASFNALHEFFVPFFFIGIGLRLAPDGAGLALGAGGLLLAVAVLGKLGGTYLPARLLSGRRTAWAMSWSMVPRAEIAMIVMRYGVERGPWAVSQAVYSAMVLVVAVTCFVVPPVLRAQLGRLRDGSE
jgi:Kef-type K+ transport system membrane component KefB